MRLWTAVQKRQDQETATNTTIFEDGSSCSSSFVWIGVGKLSSVRNTW